MPSSPEGRPKETDSYPNQTANRHSLLCFTITPTYRTPTDRPARFGWRQSRQRGAPAPNGRSGRLTFAVEPSLSGSFAPSSFDPGTPDRSRTSFQSYGPIHREQSINPL